jgi:hypothetical protein
MRWRSLCADCPSHHRCTRFAISQFAVSLSSKTASRDMISAQG